MVGGGPGSSAVGFWVVRENAGRKSWSRHQKRNRVRVLEGTARVSPAERLRKPRLLAALHAFLHSCLLCLDPGLEWALMLSLGRPSRTTFAGHGGPLPSLAWDLMRLFSATTASGT